MQKHDVAEKIIELQELLEIAKDNLLEGRRADSCKLLQQAKQELKQIIWRVTPSESEQI